MQKCALFLAACLLAILAGYGPLCEASGNKQPDAYVSSRTTQEGARVVFDWGPRAKIPFTLSEHGRQVRLHFARAVSLDWGRSLKTLPRNVVQIETVKDGSTIIFTLRRPLKAHSFLSHDKSGIELVSAKPAKHIQADEEKEAARLARIAPSAGSAAPNETPPPVQTMATAAPVAQVSETHLPSVPADHEVIDLPMKADEPLAVFSKQNTLWIVAGTTSSLSADALHKTDSHFVTGVKKIPATDATVFTLSLAGNTSAAVEKTPEGGVHLTLQHGPAKPAENLVPSLHKNAAGLAFLSIPAVAAQQMITLHDPATGDELRVVPLSSTGTGIGSERSFVEFKLLESAQGIALRKIADDVSVSLDKGVVEIATPRGLAISPRLAKQIEDNETQALESHGAATLFPYARWKLRDEKDLVPTEISLFNAMAQGTPEAANTARLKLLDIYLAEGLFVEARGMADEILRSSYAFYRDHKVSALRAASYFFTYRFIEAERDFSAPELMNNAEAAMWRGLCKDALGDENATPFNFQANYEHSISTYPPVFIQKIALIAADHDITRKDYDSALGIFDLLKKDNLDEPVRKYTDYMRARIFSENGQQEEAARIWTQQAANVDDPLIRARAEFSLVNMLLAQDKITHEEAQKRLEKIRIVWRGDALELNVLTLLGSLYVEDKKFPQALHTLRDIVLYYPDAPQAITTAKQMEQIFVDLYNKGGADAMPPLEALALFYEFRDLVPVGKEGDTMIRNLADRLVGIDLLDRAALLLDHQVRKRLQGEERSRVGAQLALIYLLNHQPKEALETLKTTGYGELPSDLQLTRLRLTAQALAQQNQVDKAIDVLSTDASAEGTQLRLSIYWDNKDWPNVVATAEDILSNRTDPGAALSAQESDVLLKLATAYVYEHDNGQIQYLRDYFTPLLAKGAGKDSFLFITSETGAIDYENLANLDQDIGSVKTFLDTYRDKVSKNGLSRAL